MLLSTGKSNAAIPFNSAVGQGESKVLQAHLGNNLNAATLVAGNGNVVYDTIGTGNWKFYVAGNTSVASISSASASSEWTGGNLLSYTLPPTDYSLYYTFDSNTLSGNTIIDSVSGNSNATLTNGAATTTTFNKIGSGSLNLSTQSGTGSSSKYLRLPTFTVSQSTGFSVSFWIYQLETANPMFIFDFATAAAQSTNNMLFVAQSYGFDFYPNSSSAGGFSITTPMILNQWVHISVAIGTTNYTTIYKNASAIYSGTPPANAFLGTAKTFAILGTSYYPYSGFKGYIDDFKIYNRELTIGEVSAIYSGPGSLKDTATGATWIPTPGTVVDATETNYTVKNNEIALTPGTNSTYAVWTAPKSTNLKIDVSFADYHSRSAGVGFQMFKINSDNTFGSVIFPRTVTSVALTNSSGSYLTVPSKSISVATGDKIYYRVDANGNTTTASSVLATNIYVDPNQDLKQYKYLQAHLGNNMASTSFVAGNANVVNDTLGTGNWNFYVAGNTSIASITGSSASSEWITGNLLSYFPNVTPVLTNYLLFYSFSSDKVSGTTVYDVVTNYAGTLINGATIAVDANSRVSGEGYLSLVAASSQYLQFPTFMTGTSGLSFACWFRSTTSSFARIFDFGDGTFSDNILMYLNSTNQLICSVKSNSADSSITNTISSVVDNTWRHVVWTLTTGDTTSVWKIYINGALFQTSSNTKYYPRNVSRTLNYLGKSNNNSEPYLNGGIDNFRYYDYVLSPSNVTSIYNNGDNDPSIEGLKNTATGATWMSTPGTPVNTYETSYTVKSNEIALTPGTNSTFAVWTAKKSTNLKIDVSFADYNTRSAGVGFQMFKINANNTFDSVLFPRTVTSAALTNANSSNYLTVPSITTTVNAGDKIYYRVDANGNTIAASSVLATTIYTDDVSVASNPVENRLLQAHLGNNLNATTFVLGNANTVLDTLGTSNWKFYVAGGNSIAAVTSSSASSEWTGGNLLSYVVPPPPIDYSLYYPLNVPDINPGNTLQVGDLATGSYVYNGTLAGGATITDVGNVRVQGQGFLSLNGVTGNTKFLTLPTITLVQSTGFSISLWAYIFSTNDGFMFHFKNTGGNDIALTSYWLDKSILYFANGLAITTFTTLNSYVGLYDKWTHICLTIAPNNFTNIYINSVSKYSGTPGVNAFAGDNVKTQTRLGSTFLPNNGLGGGIDDFRIYQRAITAAEVSAIYSSPGSLKDTATGATWIPTPGTLVDSSETNYTVKNNEIALAPGTNSTFAVWTAPKPTNIRIDVSFADYHSRSAGVGFQMFKINSDNTFGSVIFPRTVTSTALTNSSGSYLSVPSKSISVATGDKIYYRVDANGNTTAASSVLATNIYTYSGKWS